MPKKKIAKKKQRTRQRPDHALSQTAAFEKILRQTDDRTHYILKLYITGTTPRSGEAIANIRSLCEEHLSGRYDLEVVDIYQQPAMAAGEQIIAAPTLVKEFPIPTKRMVGDLGNRDRVLVGLQISGTRKNGGNLETKWTRL